MFQVSEIDLNKNDLSWIMDWEITHTYSFLLNNWLPLDSNDEEEMVYSYVRTKESTVLQGLVPKSLSCLNQESKEKKA